MILEEDLEVEEEEEFAEEEEEALGSPRLCLRLLTIQTIADTLSANKATATTKITIAQTLDIGAVVVLALEEGTSSVRPTFDDGTALGGVSSVSDVQEKNV